MSAPFIGVIDIPLNPEIVSLATLGIPANICLESISIPSNGISYISELELYLTVEDCSCSFRSSLSSLFKLLISLFI